MKTQIAIIGAGPAGLLLSKLLSDNSVDNIVIEKRTAEHVSGRIRAGILEPGTVELLKNAKIADRLTKEGLNHKGFFISSNNILQRIDLSHHANRGNVTVYGQTEITKDLMRYLKKKRLFMKT